MKMHICCSRFQHGLVQKIVMELLNGIRITQRHPSDTFQMAQAVQDGTTVKIYYESRLAKVKLVETQMSEIDKEYWRMQVNEGVEDYVVEESQKHLLRMELIIGDKDRIKQVATDIINHYEDRKDLVAGKSHCMLPLFQIHLF
ncbi:hypothetical protein ACFY5J_28300 [Peribacillus butanolivorans]|uniref:hypothetical protein n=1 Tax=Peribacillus butanolivorans TaxID=421767 RepID=UPI0036721EB7